MPAAYCKVHTFKIDKTLCGCNLDGKDSSITQPQAKSTTQYFNFKHQIKDRLFLRLILRHRRTDARIVGPAHLQPFLVSQISDIFLITCSSRLNFLSSLKSPLGLVTCGAN